MLARVQWRGAVYHVETEALALAGAHGRSWYHDAGESIAHYSMRHDLGFGRVCDVLAIVSPRVSVEFSIKLADAYLRRGDTTKLMGSRARALARYESTGAFNGPKVNAFARALRGDSDAVVIDAWMHRVLCDSPRLTPKRYGDAVDRVRKLARHLGWCPAETQAAIWTGARELVGFTAPGRMVMP